MCLSEEMQFVGGTICTDTQGSFIKYKKTHLKHVIRKKSVSCDINEFHIQFFLFIFKFNLHFNLVCLPLALFATRIAPEIITEMIECCHLNYHSADIAVVMHMSFFLIDTL